MPFLGVKAFSLPHTDRSSTISTSCGPSEAHRKQDPPLRVDPDAVLPGPVPRERLQPVARQDGQVLEGVRSVQQGEPAHGLIGELPERPDAPALEE